MMMNSPLFYFLFFLMIRRPPRSTRTDTLFPYTTLFRSGEQPRIRHIRFCNFIGFGQSGSSSGNSQGVGPDRSAHAPCNGEAGSRAPRAEGNRTTIRRTLVNASGIAAFGVDSGPPGRSEERRVGTEGVSPCRSRVSPYHSQKKKE